MGNYDDSSIKTLYGAERVRKRPASMLGSSGLQGAQHGVIEMYGNAVDEASTGYGDRIEIKRYLDGSVSIRDYGRGVPLGWNEKDRAYTPGDGGEKESDGSADDVVCSMSELLVGDQSIVPCRET